MAENARKAFTIKNALITDKQYLETIGASINSSMAEALSHLVNAHKTAGTPPENTEETDKLKAQIEQLTEQIQGLQAENQALKEAPAKQVEVEKEVIVEKTVEVEVEKPLTGSQFICELPDNVANAVRKIRKPSKQDGYIDNSTTDKDYPNALANVAIKHFINRNYSDYLR